MGNSCGPCTLCCNYPAVPELKKPINTWCEYCSVGEGCKIYNVRPESCRHYDCLWLSGCLIPDLRPDLCRVVFERLPSGKTYLALIDPRRQKTWDKKEVKKLISMLRDAHRSVVVNTRPAATVYAARGVTRAEVIADVGAAARIYGIIR